jgi:serine 3-dehydrogenase
MTSLKGKIALVTGASAGIGQASARALASEGARVVLAARRVERLEALAREIATEHGDEAALAVEMDVRDRSSVQRAAKRVDDAGLGAIDVLVNNAGLAAGLAPIHEGSFDHWDRMIETNVRGLLNVSRWVLPGMAERGGGHVVNIGSIAGREVYPNGNVYCATKFAVRAINKAMRIDLHGRGVRVTTVDPGLLETEFSIVRFDGDEERAKNVYQGTNPLRPEDVAETIVWVLRRPAHVNVEELVLMPTDQAAATMVHRRS